MISWFLQNVCSTVGGVPLVLGLGVICVTVLVMRSFGQPVKTPFGKQYILPKQPIVHDQKQRDAVLKNPFKPSQLQSTTYDAIVIGSGPGGLSTSVMLSRVGYKVLLLEQHDVPGGTTHTFKDKGFEFNTGLHYIGCMGETELFRVFMDQLTRGQVAYNTLDDSYDTICIVGKEKDRWYPMKSGAARGVSNIIKYFPSEKDGIMKFFGTLDDCFDSGNFCLGLMKMLPLGLVQFLAKVGLLRSLFYASRKGYDTTTVDDLLKNFNDNADLKIVLSYFGGDTGVGVKDSNLIHYSGVYNHFKNGAHFPVGGPSEFPYHICKEIRENGGDVFTMAHVNKILLDSDGRAIGVEVGPSKTQIYSPIIVSNTGLANLFTKLLPREIAMQAHAYPIMEKLGPSCGCLSIFVGLDATAEELNFPAGNYWVYEEGYDLDTFISDFVPCKYDDLPDNFKFPIVYFSFGAAKNPLSETCMPGRSTIEVMAPCNNEWFTKWEDEKKGRRGQDYEDRKSRLCDRMWEQVLHILPMIDGKVLYRDAGTTATNRHYLGSYYGELYGMYGGKDRYTLMSQAKLRPESGIPGLYLTGSDILTCGAIPAFITGMFTVSKIINRNVYGDLEALHKQYLKDSRLY